MKVRGFVMEESNVREAELEPIPLDVCRRLLADEAEGLSNEEVETIRRHADALAHVLIELALERQAHG